MTDINAGRAPAGAPAEQVDTTTDVKVDVPDASKPLDLGGIAVLFQRWPGATLMAVGTVLVFAAAGIRGAGVEFSGREFQGVEFAAVFLGGLVLISIGIVVLLVKERLRVEDEARLLHQQHLYRLEKAQSKTMAGLVRAAQIAKAADEAEKSFDDAYNEG